VSILCIIGTRPEAIKLAPVIRALRAQTDAPPVRVCATAQHRALADEVLRHFEIGVDIDLDIMRPDQSLPQLTAMLFRELAGVVEREQPEWVVVQGDTTSALAGALAAEAAGTQVAHVEAGLRTFDTRDPFPEEINRQVIARASTLHFAPTDQARGNLLNEGVPEATIHVTGNTGIDALQWTLQQQPVEPLAAPRSDVKTILVTIHRREAFGHSLRDMCVALRTIVSRAAGRVRVVWPVHPNPNVSMTAAAELSGIDGIELIDPVPYPRAVALLNQCDFVMTDSGGLQEEAPALGKPTLVLRERTERPEGVTAGIARLVGRDPDRIVAAAMRLLDDADEWARMAKRVSPYGDGLAGPRIAALLIRAHSRAARATA
jgi:UDP-N-acetylglucosamine 2-epimerase (non-hydrolysing)